MNTLMWVLAGVAVYWLGLIVLRSRDLLPSYIGAQGPILTIHTKRGKKLLDWLARPKRFWRAWGNFGLGITLVVMGGTFLLLVVQAVSVLQSPPPATAVNQPENFLIIPGVNEFLPLSVAPEILLGLLVGLVVHEGGHGIFCRVGDIDVDSMGVVLLAVLPIGAFVEPNEESQKEADRGARSRMFAAGVTNNFAVTFVAFALLFGPVVGSIGVAPGAAISGVLPGSAAADAGLGGGDRITELNGQPIESNGNLTAALAETDDRTVSVTLADGETLRIERSLLVTGIDSASPFASGVGKQSTVVAVNGTEVHTESAFERLLDDRPVATLTVEDANGTQTTTVTGAVGALVSVDAGSPTAETLPTDSEFVVTAVDGERIANSSDLLSTLDALEPNRTVTVEAYVNGSLQSYDVTTQSGSRPLGLASLTQGVSGMSVSEFGTEFYPAGQFLNLLGGGFLDLVGTTGGPVVSFLMGALGTLLLPFASVSLGAADNFAGFVAFNSNFYVVEGGPLSGLGGGVYLLANALFWTGWINLNLGFFNCIPAFPLDGGRILRTSTEAIVSRLPVPERNRVTTMVTTTIGLVMLVSLILMVFGPQLLAG